MRELLVISWEMPPLSGPRAVQVTRTLRELALRGWRSRVICFGPRSRRYNQDFHVALEDETAGAVRRLPVTSPEERFFFRALWRVCPPLKRLPDEKRVWIPGALAAARRAIAERRPDAIVSFAQPWSDHLVGLELRRETGLPWVAHFSDPWLDSPYLRAASWQRRAIARMEQDVISEATRLVFVNAHTAEAVMGKYPAGWRVRAAVVPQGFDPRDAGSASPPPGPELRIAYAGRFYEGMRTPDTFFQAIAALRTRRPLDGRLSVDIIGGAMSPFERRASSMGLGGIVSFHGRRGPDEAAAIASAADALLVIDAPSRGANLFLPSKLVDYLPLRKPILGLTPRAGATADLLGRLGYDAIDPADVAGIAAALERLLDAKAAGTLERSPCHDAVAAAYDIRETTKAMERVLEDAVKAA